MKILHGKSLNKSQGQTRQTTGKQRTNVLHGWKILLLMKWELKLFRIKLQ